MSIVNSSRAWWAFSLAAMLGACTVHKAPPPPSTDIDETGYRNDLRILASEEFEGRKPGTRGEDKTVAFLSAQFKRFGLKPAVGESYVQPVPLIEISAGADASLTVSGGRGGARPLRYGKDVVIWTKQALPLTELRNSALVFVGYGIEAPEFHWNDYANLDVRGKTLLILANDPGYGSKDPGVFRGNSMSLYGRAEYKFEEAARRGAAGVLLIHDAAAVGFGWTSVVNTWSGPQLELAAPEGGATRAALEGWIGIEAARGLFGQAGLDFGALEAKAARPGFTPVEMGLNVDAQLHNSTRRFNSANLIGVLPGANRKRDYVVYTAHWDALGRDASGAPLNGAVEDASGVAGLLMLAQSFSHARPVPDRSIAFIAFTAGEAGLLGSQYYVENPVLALQQTVGVLDLDGLHVGGPTRDVFIMDAGNSEIEDLVRGAALLQGRELRPEWHPEFGAFYRSDQLNFALHGVPTIDVKGGIDDAARGPAFGQAQAEDYLAHRYRQSSDQYSEDWDVRGAVEDLSLYYALGDRLARSRRFPRWYATSEFSSTRRRERQSDDE